MSSALKVVLVKHRLTVGKINTTENKKRQKSLDSFNKVITPKKQKVQDHYSTGRKKGQESAVGEARIYFTREKSLSMMYNINLEDLHE